MEGFTTRWSGDDVDDVDNVSSEEVVNTKEGDGFAPGGMRRVGVLGLAKNARVHREKCPDSQGQKLPEPAHVPTQLDVSRT